MPAAGDTCEIADSARRFLVLAARWTTRRSASSGCAGVMWRCGLPVGAHLTFSWLVLPVYGVVCSQGVGKVRVGLVSSGTNGRRALGAAR